MDEYMTYFMFKDGEESDAKTSYSSSLAASVGASFFKIAVVPIPVNTRSGQLSKALSEGPLLQERKSYSGVLEGRVTSSSKRSSSPLI